MSKKKRKPKFQKIWGSLTDIGLGFGLSAGKLGTILKQLELRDPSGKPTEETITKGLAVATPTRTGHEHYMWNRWEIARLLKEQGYSKKVDTRDPLHPVAIEVHRLAQEGQRLEQRGEDKPAIWAYEAAIEAFQEPLVKAKHEKVMGVAIRLHTQVAGLMGDTDDLQFLYQGAPVTWEEVQAQRKSAKLDQVLPKSERPDLKPRM